MNAQQENRVSMYFKIRTFFVSYLSVIAARITAMTALVTLFNNLVDALIAFEIIASQNITGYAEQKNALRKSLSDKAFAIGNGIKAYFKSINERHEAKKHDFSRSSLEHLRDSDLVVFCEGINDTATGHAADIIAFGVSSVMLSAYSDSLDAYKLFIQQPTTQRSKSSMAGEDVDRTIIEIDEVLESIDAMMNTLIEDEPSIYGQYKLDRMIDDMTGGSPSTPPDYTLTIPAGGFAVACTIPYLASRTFKAKNPSDFPIKWCLSSEEAAFSSEPHILNANSISAKLSNTLAPDGDHLLFQNENPEDVAVEVWMME